MEISKIANQVTAAAYIRLLLPSILTNTERLVYLDCDIVVLKDIAELHDADLRGLPLAATVDYGLLSDPTGWQIGTSRNALSLETYLTEVIALSDWRSYFNSGVLVMDLPKLRDTNLIEAAQRFLKRINGRGFLNDQCALNHVVSGAYARLDPRWNVTSGFALDPARNSARVTREIAERLAAVAKALEAAQHAPEEVAMFLMRCLFTMFAEDVGLLPEKSFKDVLER